MFDSYSLPIREELFCLIKEHFLIRCQIIFFFNRFNRTDGFTSAAINTNIRIYIKLLFSFFDAINRTNANTLTRFLSPARVQYYKCQFILTSLISEITILLLFNDKYGRISSNKPLKVKPFVNRPVSVLLNHLNTAKTSDRFFYLHRIFFFFSAYPNNIFSSKQAERFMEYTHTLIYI